MISKVKDLMAVGEKLDSVSKKVSAVKKEVDSQSEDLAGFSKEVSSLKVEMAKFNTDASKFCTNVGSQAELLMKARADLEKEVYDFKLIKADIKSKLVSELAEDFRHQLKKEAEKLDTDVKHFNELKDELSKIVSKFKSVEAEIDKFKAIANQVKAADFQLERHAKELAKADEEKLKLLQKIDHLERLVSKMRRSTR
jgi:chromosome segregation ATPase